MSLPSSAASEERFRDRLRLGELNLSLGLLKSEETHVSIMPLHTLTSS